MQPLSQSFRFERNEVLVVVLAVLLAMVSVVWALSSEGEVHEAIDLEGFEPKVGIQVNSCPPEHFLVVRGIGERRAEQIVEAREAGGPFKSFEEMLERVPLLKNTNIDEFKTYLDFSLSDGVQ